MSFGAADGRVVIDTQLNNAGFIKGVSNMKGQLGGLQSVVRGLSVAIAAAFSVRALINFGKECIELGSNVQEVQNVVDVAFGDMSERVDEFASGAIKNFGMSQLAAKKTASTYMAMAKGMGVADDAAADMSLTLAGLTGDVASFFNISQELADVKLKSVFTGETETLKDLGVVMTQDNLKAFALSQGITKSYESMDQAEKVALRYNFVLDALGMAQGDFARTANSWANQTRILSMLWQEFMSIIGQALTTVLTPLVQVANQVVSSMISMANTVNAVVSSLFGGAATQIRQTQDNALGVGDAIEGAVESQKDLTAETKETAKAQEGTLAGFDEINKLSGDSTGSAGGGAGVTVASPETAVEVISSDAGDGAIAYLQQLKDAFQPTIEALDRLRDAAAPLGEDLFAGLSWAWENIFQPLGTWVGGEALPAFLDLLSAGMTLLDEVIETLTPGATWLWENFLSPLASWTGDLVVEGLQELSDLLEDITAVLTGDVSFEDFVSNLTPVQTALLGIAAALGAITLANAASQGLNSISASIAGIQNGTGVIGKLVEVLALTAGGAGTLSEAMNAVFGPGSIIAGVAAIIGGAVLAVTNFATMLENGFSWANEALMLLGIAITAVGAIILGAPALVAGVVAAIVAVIATLVVVAKENWESIKATWSVVADWFNTNVVQPIAKFFSGLWTGIKTAAGTLASWLKNNVITPIVSLFRGLYNSVAGIVEGLINGFVRVINSFIRGINNAISLINNIPGVELPELSTMASVSIPRLATGTVVPQNREFLAVLGDNKTETEVVSPLSTIKQALLEALQEAGGLGGDITVELVMDGEKMATKLVRRINNMTIRNGKSALLY